jgi:hypothetical protein
MFIERPRKFEQETFALLQKLSEVLKICFVKEMFQRKRGGSSQNVPGNFKF